MAERPFRNFEEAELPKKPTSLQKVAQVLEAVRNYRPNFDRLREVDYIKLAKRAGIGLLALTAVSAPCGITMWFIGNSIEDNPQARADSERSLVAKSATATVPVPTSTAEVQPPYSYSDFMVALGSLVTNSPELYKANSQLMSNLNDKHFFGLESNNGKEKVSTYHYRIDNRDPKPDPDILIVRKIDIAKHTTSVEYHFRVDGQRQIIAKAPDGKFLTGEQQIDLTQDLSRRLPPHLWMQQKDAMIGLNATNPDSSAEGTIKKNGEVDLVFSGTLGKPRDSVPTQTAP